MTTRLVARGPEFPEKARAAVPAGVDGLVDGALLDQPTARAVRDGGRITTLRGSEGMGERGVAFQPVWIAEYARQQTKLDHLRRQVEDGQVTLRVARILPAEQAAEAHRLLEAGGVRGRLILTF
ncbi:zinc-binding dehydrogenase [Actinomadura sp. NPDC048394]|jgi:NADPH:quinone reductase-like Zn-dependent oxidoreductase|uniref:zinc-binding dehydrogenase n=1 Tax=Actinomadura sp. NPDC048394 TaxID=3158223 RepID=UPI0033E636AD